LLNLAGPLTALTVIVPLRSTGATIDFWSSAERDVAAAKRFFQKALQSPDHPRPRVITVDGNPSYPKVIAELKQERKLANPVQRTDSPSYYQKPTPLR
jgi:transposase-like protein